MSAATSFVVNLGSTSWPDMRVLPMLHDASCYFASTRAIPAHWQRVDGAVAQALRTADSSTVRICAHCCPGWARALAS